MKPLFSTFALGVLFAAVCSAGPVTLTPDSWETEPFTLMSAGDLFPDAYQATVAGTVDITGYYVTGDYYNVFVNGNLVLTTTQVLPANVDYGDRTPSQYSDPASAFTSGLFSTGQFHVNDGDLITITDLYPPGGIGEAGVVELSASSVPEPATVALIGLGIVGVIIVGRRAKPVHG